MIRSAAAVPESPEIFRLALCGKVYAPEAPAVEAEIDKALAKGARHFVLACSALEQVDSAVLSALIAALEKVKSRKNGKIVFVGVNATVRRILSLTKMDKFFPIAADEAEALSLIAGSQP